LDHPEIIELRTSEMLSLMAENGALIVQAHPFREAWYIDHIRLYPRSVHGVECYNASQKDFVNSMAEHYADAYGLIRFAGSDNHTAGDFLKLGGMKSDTPIKDEKDFVMRVKSGMLSPFKLDLEGSV
jgi:predicted metal-dependent phosphoesterase TrpH